jgi:ABC-type lipoprotein export system ATPase subunit
MPAQTPAIVLDKVSHFYGQGALRKQILFDICAEIRTGEIIIVTGPSGSGKTTALTLVGALRSAQEGSVRVPQAQRRSSGYARASDTSSRATTFLTPLPPARMCRCRCYCTKAAPGES